MPLARDNDPSHERGARRRLRSELIDEWLYPAFAAACVLWVALLFYSALRLQLFYSTVRPDEWLRPDDWSAPLDDVFIHLDFARAAARGYPFQWSEGNGYSSGGTSLLYPFVLALGYRLGLAGSQLMVFAAVVACVSVLATLMAVRPMFRRLPAWTAYLAPPVFLSIGALNWSLFSGMEVAFFMATWGAAYVAWEALLDTPSNERLWPRAWGLGLLGAIVVMTRPEAALCVAIFGFGAAARVVKTRGFRAAAATLVAVGVPGALVVVAHAVANRVFTGDWSAAGALVKLELHHPLLSKEQVIDAWKFHVKYQVLRVTGYHVAENPWIGALLWVIAAVPLFFAKTRRAALLLWASAIAWVLVIALNGQVRWQNERYTMPAVAWLLLSVALGLGVLLTHPWGRGRRGIALRVASGAVAIVLVGVLAVQQAPRFRDQVWFFARASRNIRDQHVKAARKLTKLHPTPRRVLVGDAGAIPYESDLPALDIIGLGGYFDLPFARASRWGVAATVELIERIPPRARPDVLAIYPTWWGNFPLWFGRQIDGVSVRGNVICGGLTKVIYRSDWRALDHQQRPLRSLDGRARVVDALDVADVVSERRHQFAIEGAVGYVTMKLLEAPARDAKMLWDAGRVVPAGAKVRGRFEGFSSGGRPSIVIRLAPAQAATLQLTVDGKRMAPISVEPADEWVEREIELPVMTTSAPLDVAIEAADNEVVLYHLWGVETE